MHRLLIEKGLGDRMETAPSYWKVLGKVGWFNLRKHASAGA